MSKRPKLLDFRKDCKISQSALVSVLKKVRDEGIPDSISRASFVRERRKIATQDSPFGRLIQECVIGKKCINVPFIHPLALLCIACQRSAAFADMMTTLLDVHGDRINIIIYSDEVTPGQALAARNARKFEAIYWSIEEFPGVVLSQEDAWFVLTCIRTDLVDEIEGGMSHLYKHMLKQFFGAPNTHDLRSGVQIEVNGRNHLVFGKLGLVLQDERAHKFAFHCKGSGGHHVCLECANVLNHWSSWLPDPNNWLVPSTCIDKSRWRLHSSTSIRAVLKRLRDIAEHGTKAELELKEQELGFNHHASNCLLDEDLNINLASVVCWDWTHCYLVKGSVYREVNALL